MGDVAAGHLRPGDWIAGKYQVERVLGAGGMGVVVAARHAALRQTVAIKLLLPSALRFPDAAARFLREAQAAVAIRSEHVARVLDVGSLETGAPYMVMEFLAGRDLRAFARERGPLPVGEAVDYLLQAGEAIAEAHSLGIVHRDLKPANIFLTARADGSSLVKVLDFGLSKVTGQGPEHERGLTATDVVAGSPEYMSPEQVRSLKDVDGRTDIWALGVVLYELLTGHRPFQGPTAAAICAAVAADTPAPVRSHRAELPEGLARAIEGCLVKDRHRRIGSMGELAAALAPFAPAESAASIERIARISGGQRASIVDMGAPWGTGQAAPPAVVAVPERAPREGVAVAPLRAASAGAAASGAAVGAAAAASPAALPSVIAASVERAAVFAPGRDSPVAALSLPFSPDPEATVPWSRAAPASNADSSTFVPAVPTSSGPAFAGMAPALTGSATSLREPAERSSTTGRSGHTDGWGQTDTARVPPRRGPIVAVAGAAVALVVTVGVVLWQVSGAPSTGGVEPSVASASAPVAESPRAEPSGSGPSVSAVPGPVQVALPVPSASAVPVPVVVPRGSATSGASGAAAPATASGVRPAASSAKPAGRKPPAVKAVESPLDVKL